jgi:hypothetical protein
MPTERPLPLGGARGAGSLPPVPLECHMQGGAEQIAIEAGPLGFQGAFCKGKRRLAGLHRPFYTSSG